VHTVNYADTPIWTVGIGVSYADMSINLGETMEFASYSAHDVVLVDGTPPSKGNAWDLCGATGITPGNMTSIWAVTDYTHDSVMYQKALDPANMWNFLHRMQHFRTLSVRPAPGAHCEK